VLLKTLNSKSSNYSLNLKPIVQGIPVRVYTILLTLVLFLLFMRSNSAHGPTKVSISKIGVMPDTCTE